MTTPGYDFNNPGWNANPGTGHFTQVVWKASTQLGIGKAEKNGCIYVVGRYSPAGNMGGQYKSNVLKPTNWMIDPCNANNSSKKDFSNQLHLSQTFAIFFMFC